MSVPTIIGGTVTETAIIAQDFRGTLAVRDGVVFYLTGCCQASAKGSANSPTGVCCRACYRTIDEDLSRAWLANEQAAWDRYSADLWFAALEAGANDDLANRAVMGRVARRAQAAAVAA